jgi:hypothetical protein
MINSAPGSASISPSEKVGSEDDLVIKPGEVLETLNPGNLSEPIGQLSWRFGDGPSPTYDFINGIYQSSHRNELFADVFSVDKLPFINSDRELDMMYSHRIRGAAVGFRHQVAVGELIDRIRSGEVIKTGIVLPPKLPYTATSARNFFAGRASIDHLIGVGKGGIRAFSTVGGNNEFLPELFVEGRPRPSVSEIIDWGMAEYYLGKEGEEPDITEVLRGDGDGNSYVEVIQKYQNDWPPIQPK